MNCAFHCHCQRNHISLTQHIFLALLLKTGGHIVLVIALVCQIAAHIKLKNIVVLALYYMRQI